MSQPRIVIMKKIPLHRSLFKRRVPTFEQLESRRLMVADWQNAVLPSDVDYSGIVAPIDALIVSFVNPSRI